MSLHLHTGTNNNGVRRHHHDVHLTGGPGVKTFNPGATLPFGSNGDGARRGVQQPAAVEFDVFVAGGITGEDFLIHAS